MSDITGHRVHFPTPKVTYDYGMRSIGYENHVIFPVVFDVAHGGVIDLKGTIIMGVCQDICIPVEVHIKAQLPSGGGQEDTAIVAALQDRPHPGPAPAVCTIKPTEDSVALQVSLPLVMTTL